MNIRYEHKPAMTFIGYSTFIRPEEGYQKCPEFWEKEYAQRFARLWQTMQPENPLEAAILENGVGMFAICEERGDSFEYWIAGLYRGGEVPEGLKKRSFPEGDWAMFSAKGPLPGFLQALNAQVLQEWLPGEGRRYCADGKTMLEVYSPGDMRSPDYECGIWVPVRLPEEEDEYEAAEIVPTMMTLGIL